MNTFGAGEKHVCTGDDELFSAGDKHIKSTHSDFSHIHTASYQWFPNRTYMYVKMIASHSYSSLKTGVMTLWRSKSYVETQWRLPLHWLGRQGQKIEITIVKPLLTHGWLLANSLQPVAHAFSSLHVTWLYVPCPEHVEKERPRSQQTRTWSI